MADKEKCELPAVFRYTWAGQDESFCCLMHGQQIKGMTIIMGYHLQLIELPQDTVEVCQSIETVK